MTVLSEDHQLSLLILEPYCGGSHAFFLSGISRLSYAFESITLPARNWKWRMRLAAPYFAKKLQEDNRRFDRILCSPFVDAATFRGMAPKWVREVPLLTYFHENQFAYPVQIDDERDLHYGLTNMTTALASDSVAFNSEYNLRSFLGGIEATMKHSSDLKLHDPCSAIMAKSRVLPVAIDFQDIDAVSIVPRVDAPVLIWNHRWQNDKNPRMFFNTLFELDDEGINFRLIVLGQSFTNSPEIFSEAKNRLHHKIMHFGCPSSRKEYAMWLKHGDIVISTSHHEFFGIAVVEAVRAGCRPLLPRRLSYPELYPDEYLYDDENFKQKLNEFIREGTRLSQKQSKYLTDRFSWKTLSPAYESWISDVIIS